MRPLTLHITSHFLALAALLAAPRAARAQTDPRVDAYVKQQMQALTIPSVQVAVRQHGKLLASAAYGTASLELAVPATPRHVYALASATKPVTAVAVGMLVDEGKLAFDDTLGALLPSLPPAWRGVTVAQLLGHTSGLPDVVRDPMTLDLVAPTRDSALAVLATMPMQAAPGAQWSYNQTNYVLLGMLVERLGGMPFPDFAAVRILRPLGLASMTFGDSYDVIPNRVPWYSIITRGADGRMRRAPAPRVAHVGYVPFMRTAAGLNGTASDVARFVEAVAQGKLVRPATRDQLWTAVPLADGRPFRMEGQLGVGLGWLVDDTPGRRFVGGTGGSSVAYHHYPASGLTVAVLTNLQGIDPDALVDGIAALYLPPAPARAPR
jgi:CubicO group peptidase (beta-lactamase class C family)